jgi:hypothetical protein
MRKVGFWALAIGAFIFDAAVGLLVLAAAWAIQ